MKKLSALLLLLFLCATPLVSDNADFPQGSTKGDTDMERTLAPSKIPFVNLGIRAAENGGEIAFSVQMLLLLTVISIAPSILLLTTSFLRLSIALDFVKRAMSLQQVPPTQVLNGIALFLTLFIMWPTVSTIYTNAFKPMADGEINIETAYTRAEQPMRLFMYRQMAHDPSFIRLTMAMAKLPKPANLSEVPTYALIPAYILHELTIAFQIGIFLYLPFIIIDMVVASILMSMGMIMLPPIQISMPFKLMLFVLVDGWNLLIGQLFNSFL